MANCKLRFWFAPLASGVMACGLSCLGQNIPEIPKIPASRLPDVGENAPHGPRVGNFQCVVNSAQAYPCYSMIVDGVAYTVAFHGSGPELGRVADVRTSDKDFRTPDGLRIGDVITIRSDTDLILAPYFAVYANRGTKWIPVIGFMDNLSIVQIDGKDKIVPLKEVELNGSEIRVRISGFVERKGVDPRSAAKD